jgi:predicted GNAT family N-acyltransferase
MKRCDARSNPRAHPCAVLEEQRLDAAIHDCAGFDGGVPALNDYLCTFANQYPRRCVSQTYRLADDRAPTRDLGCYTLSAAQHGAESLSVAERKRWPRYPIPCIRMGRVAVSLSRRGQGYVRVLIRLSVERCLTARQEVAAYALIVDAKDESAAEFYRHYSFTACRDAPRTLCPTLSSGRGRRRAPRPADTKCRVPTLHCR